jgi:hypothetical protein
MTLSRALHLRTYRGGGTEVIWFSVGYGVFSLLFLIWWARGLPPAESLSPSQRVKEQSRSLSRAFR